MRRLAAPLLLALTAVLLAHPAAAQDDPPPPGPYVVDLRVATSGVPAVPLSTPGPVTGPIDLPTRGTGFDVGGHVYAGRLGPARLGFGASVLAVTASNEAGEAAFRAIVPQISFNFGTRSGWSYLSLGAGRAKTTASSLVGSDEVRSDGTQVVAVYAGGGARWCVSNHVAVGFDLRLHRAGADGATPAAMLVAASAGISLR